MCPMNMALMSRLGSSFGQRSNASLTASAKISREYKPSCFPNLESPADMIETSGLPFKLLVPSVHVSGLKQRLKTTQKNAIRKRIRRKDT